ncbi:TlpA disulfide reductase family protein [Siphonobacter sp. SORGH_AS_0500]|uniref:TlpA family protein disulfide reductase n=1 Tax=Siphonobacter sp. SORGH_AS_0500 TaxID=1864824 RepID=UPI00285C60C7|nr:TlpA disulfide reductase family protein [Siphonobacter sp. SORGH_AS_0500]MDR6197102.1 thiol-disulfide isomerase/thioredoxin [Siphonobacter sp. SORGH_AS_0500]
MKTLILGLSLLLSSSLFGQNPTQRVVFTPAVAKPGDQLLITYTPEGSALAGKKDIRAVVYTYDNYAWHANDLPLTQEGQTWKAKLQLGKDCGLATIKYQSGKLVDNNDNQSFTIMLKSDTSPQAPGAYAGWGLMRSPNYGLTIPGYLEGVSISDTATYHWMNQEISSNFKQAGSKVAVPFARSLYKFQGEAAMPRINRATQYLMGLSGEENLMKAYTIFSQIPGSKTRADSLQQALEKQFPAGNLARLKAFRQMNLESNFEKKVELSRAFLQKFPYNDADYTFNHAYNVNYTSVYLNLAIQTLLKKDYAALTALAHELPFSAIPTIYYKTIEIAHKRKDEADDKTLLAPAQALLDRMESFKNQRPADYWYLSPLEYQATYEEIFLRSIALTQIQILRNTGHFEEALALANRTQQVWQYKRAELNNEQALLLDHFNKPNELRELLVKSMHENQSSPEMLELLKKDYQRSKGSLTGFETYVEGLKSQELASKELKELEKIMVNKDMPDWTMKDGNGKTVKFSQLRGKTIVMDFWATWCIPCKASFPGMKLAVEKYKNDPDVLFFFVDTEERTPNYKQEIMQYIKENNYPFVVLFDNKLPNAKANDEVFKRICKAFSISGIPQKLIIDKKGKLRFITVGFKGSATGLSDEISAMVELTKKAE